MEHLIEYKQYKDTIDGLLPSASHSLYSLVTLLQDCDNIFMKMVKEKSELSANRELAISAAQLFDAYELVEDAMIEAAKLITKIGMDESNGLDQYANVSDYIDPAKELMPLLELLVTEVSSQMSDFIGIHRQFQYTGLESLTPVRVRDYIEINSKVAKISKIIHTQVKESHSQLVGSFNQIGSALDHTNVVYESKEAVKGECFVAIIPNVSIIDVGETEAEVLKKVKSYFDDDVSDVTIKPCSRGLYNYVMDGNIPDEWDEVDGVIVMNGEKELFTEHHQQ